MITDFLFGLPLLVAGFKSKVAQIPDGKIHYFSKHSHPSRGTVVFLHGIGASSAHFGQVMGLLSREGYSIFAPDLPSHGRSSDLDCDLTGETLYQAFVSWADRVVPGKFVLIGNSLGGALSLRFALDHPERIEKLVLASPAGGFETKEEWEEFKKGLLFSSLSDSRNFLDKIYNKSPFFLPFISPFFYLAMTQKGIQQLVRQTQFQEFDHNLKKIEEKMPVLLIWGKSERLFSPKNLKYLRKKLPSHVTYEEPEGIGHCPQMDNPHWFAQRLLSFLK
jgi:pimeloyl-ACP methyl ester carboxylesterase